MLTRVLTSSGGIVRRQLPFAALGIGVIAAAVLAISAATGAAQKRGETFTADASVARPNGTVASAKLTAVVDSFASDAERDALITAVKHGGTAARDLLASRKSAGSIQVGSTQTPIRYAYARSAGSGRLITLITAEPIHFVGGDLPDAKPKDGYDLGLVLLDLSSSKGSGEVAPAAKVKVDAQNAVVTDDYGAEVVRLTNVVRK